MNRNEQIAYVLAHMPWELTRVEFTTDFGIDLYFGAGICLIMKRSDTQKDLAFKVRGLRKQWEKVS